MLRRPTLTASLALALAATALAQVPTPKEVLGFDVCDDYMLANYTQLVDYWRRLEAASDRIRLVSIGKTEEGREQYMAYISAPENLATLEQHRQNSRRFADPRTFSSDAEAEALAETAKAVVWIDGGLHATETLGAQQLIETAYQLVSRNDPENRRILRDCIVLLVHANPDGMDLVSDWYMRRENPRQRSLNGVPVLYQKYIGHDNNRDFYASNMKETQNMNRVLYREWFPQIVYNHHQSSPAGTIMFIPPFRNPFNYHVDPLVQIGTDLVGIHMHRRLISEGKTGTVMRNGASFSAWWNGGLRTTTYFHNMVGILTETFGSPNPTQVPFLKPRQIPSIDLPSPVDAGPWRMRQSLEYEVSANYAILDYASRFREKVLMDVYRSAKNAIARGSRDHWTRYPSRIDELGAEALTRPELRDARIYVIPSDQPDFSTARKFVDKLMITGVEAHVLTQSASGFPAGSLVIRADQPYRPHVLDMFEPQDYPNEFQYPGGPPIRPYDNAGYTLAYQMGIVFQRLLEPVTLPTQPLAASTPRSLAPAANPVGVIALSTANDGFHLANRAFSLGMNVFRLSAPFRERNRTWPAGSIYVPADAAGIDRLMDDRRGPTLWGDFAAVSTAPATVEPLNRPRIALWDRYGGSMPSGWTRWLLEQFGFAFDVVYPPDLDAGNLRTKYDVILFPTGAIPGTGGGGGGGGQAESQLANDPTVPEEFRRRIGQITSERTIPQLRAFVEQGGHIIAIGSSASNLARQFGLPVASALVEVGEDGRERPLPDTKFYIPGSVLSAKVEQGPLTIGMPDRVDVMFDNSPAFRLTQDLPEAVAMFFDSERPLRSGWAWGQEALQGSAAVLDLPMGQGRVVLCGPELLFRAQPHGTFKLVFNALMRAAG